MTSASDGSRIVFGMSGAYGLTGGIPSLNRNVVRALIRVADARGGNLLIVSLHETESAEPPDLPENASFRGCGSSRIAYALRIARAALGVPALMVFDHVTLARPALPFALWRGLSTVVFAHGSEAWREVTPVSKRTFRAADLCVANSSFTLEMMEERVGAFRGVACPLGLPPQHALNREPPGPCPSAPELTSVDGVDRELGERVLLLVGRMDADERRKGHRELLAALPLVLEGHPDAQLVAAGPGNDAGSIAAEAEERGLGHCVFLPGHVSDEELEALYRRCYAFVMPSRQEGFGLVYLEAMNHARPCVGCREDGAATIIVDGETGLLVDDPTDRRELASVLIRLLSDPARAREMGRRGFRLLHERFTARHVRDRIVRHVEAVL